MKAIKLMPVDSWADPGPSGMALDGDAAAWADVGVGWLMGCRRFPLLALTSRLAT